MIDASSQLRHAVDRLHGMPGAAERATSRAINAAGEVARASAEAEILKRYAAKPGDVRAALRLTTSRPATLSASLTARSGAAPLGYFPHTPTEPGTGGPGKPILTAEIVHGANKSVAGAFIANLSSGPRVMKRDGRSIRSLYSIPIARMLGVPEVMDPVERAALLELDAALGREIDRELAKPAVNA